MDAAGVVDEVGDGVSSGVRVGDAVMAMVVPKGSHGAYREQIVLDARAVVPAGTAIDQVVPTWIAASFSPGMQVLIAIGLLCAGFSTLEGILLAIASIVSIDVHPTLDRLGLSAKLDALLLGRLSLVLVAVVTAVMALRQLANPTGGTVAIFAQYGVYLLLCGTSVPLVCGMFLPRASRVLVFVAASISIKIGRAHV